MKFEMIVPTMSGYTADDIVNAYIATVETRMKGDWPVIAELYVTFDPQTYPIELDVGSVAGKVSGKPEKNVDGKWTIDVELSDTKEGKAVKTLIPYLEKDGQPMKVMILYYTDGKIVMGPYALNFTNKDIFQSSKG
jgi:hypothetical protein